MVEGIGKVCPSRMVSVRILLVEVGCHCSRVQGLCPISTDESGLVCVQVIFIEPERVALSVEVWWCSDSKAVSSW